MLEGDDPGDVHRLAQLLDFIDAELLGGCNFEFLQVRLLTVQNPHTGQTKRSLHTLALCTVRCSTAAEQKLDVVLIA